MYLITRMSEWILLVYCFYIYSLFTALDIYHWKIVLFYLISQVFQTFCYEFSPKSTTMYKRKNS